MQAATLFLLCVVTTCMLGAHGYSSGADSAACANVRPPSSHGTLQSGNGGYSLSFSPAITTYQPGVTYDVTLTGSNTFDGFLMVASAGQLNVKSGETRAQSGPCSDPSITHTNSASKNNIQMTWTAPSSGNADIDFDFAVLRNKGLSGQMWKRSYTFGVDTSASTAAPTTTLPTTTAQVPDMPLESSAYVSVPSGCISNPQTECKFEARWRVVDDSMMFKLRAKTNGWVGIGFADSPTMIEADIYMATMFTGPLQVTNRHASARSLPSLDASQDGLEALYGNMDGDFLEVYFSRSLEPINAKDVDLSDETLSKHLLFAWGPGSSSSHADKGSAQGPLVTSQTIQLQAVGPQLLVAPTKATDATIAHGILMIWAWVFLAPVGLLFPELLKFLGKLWYQMHRNMQVLAALVCIAAFIVVAVEVDFRAAVHQILGIVVVALVVVQVLLGAFRNKISKHDPQSARDADDHGERRWLFNYLHWTVGLVLTVLAQVTIYFGLDVIGVQSEAFVVYAVWVFGDLIIRMLVISSVRGDENKANVMRRKLGASVLFALALAGAATLTAIVAETPQTTSA